MIITEINHHHLKVIKHQQEYYNLPHNGFICVKPNCSIQSYMFVLDALIKKSYELDNIQVCTFQALSGAGYKAIKNKSFQNNVIPYIKNEEIKTEEEPLKIFGKIKDKVIKNSEKINISAFCNRVPVIDGHTAIVSISFKGKKPSIKKFKKILESYSSLPQTLELPTAPIKPIYIMEDIDRPQPKNFLYPRHILSIAKGATAAPHSRSHSIRRCGRMDEGRRPRPPPVNIISLYWCTNFC